MLRSGGKKVSFNQARLSPPFLPLWLATGKSSRLRLLAVAAARRPTDRPKAQRVLNCLKRVWHHCIALQLRRLNWPCRGSSQVRR